MFHSTKSRLLLLFFWGLPFVGSASLETFCSTTFPQKDELPRVLETLLVKTDSSRLAVKERMQLAWDTVETVHRYYKAHPLASYDLSRQKILSQMLVRREAIDKIHFSFQKTSRLQKQMGKTWDFTKPCPQIFTSLNSLFYITSTALTQLKAFSQKLELWLADFSKLYALGTELPLVSPWDEDETEHIQFFIRHFSILTTLKEQEFLAKTLESNRIKLKDLREHKTQLLASRKTSPPLSEITQQLLQSEELLRNTQKAFWLSKNKAISSFLWNENTLFGREIQKTVDKTLDVQNNFSKMRANLQKALPTALPKTIQSVAQIINRMQQEVEGQVRTIEQKYGYLKTPRYWEHSRWLALLFPPVEAKPFSRGAAKEEQWADECSMVFLRIQKTVLNQMAETLTGVQRSTFDVKS